MTAEQYAVMMELLKECTWALIGTMWALIVAVTWKG